MEEQAQSILGTEKRIGKLIFNLSLPIIVAQIANALYGVVDRIYIGHIPEVGANALTGLGVTFPLIIAVSAFSALVAFGGAPRATIMMGKNDNDEAERILGNCTTALVLISVILTFVLLFFSEKMLFMCGASENTIIYALPYMKIYSLGTVFVQLTLGLNAFITTQGFAKISMGTVIIGAIANIILDPIFIFVFKMGVSGAALATIISQCMSAIWVISFLMGKKTTLKIKLKNLRIQPKILFPCMLLGLAPFVMQFTESALFIVYNSSLYKYGGDISVGIMTILSSIMQFSLFPLNGLTQGAQPVISYNFGAGNADRVKKAVKILLISTCTYCLVMWALVMGMPKVFIGVFTNDMNLVSAAVTPLRIYMAASLIFGIQVGCQNAFIAIGNAKHSLFLAILRKIGLLIPFIFILPLFMTDKVTAVFLAEPISDIIAVLTTGILFYYQFKKSMKIIENRS